MAAQDTEEKVRNLKSFHKQLDLFSEGLDKYVANTEVVFPFPLPTFTLSDRPAFGDEMKEKHFLLSKEFTYINHGAFGSSIKEAFETMQAFQRHAELQPARFLDRLCLPLLAKLTQKLSTYVNCDADGLALVPNTTYGVDSVLKSLPLKAGDSVYFLDVAYGAVKTCIRHVCDKMEATPVEHDLPYPLNSTDEILEMVASTLPTSGCKLAVFDHIPSNVPIIMPVKELVEMCHKRGIPVLIDGAHALGFMKVNLRDIGADFYVTNSHKWFSSPKSGALLYTSEEFRSVIRPLVISHGFNKGYVSNFIWAGTKFNANYLAMYTALDFWKGYDEQSMRTYCYNLLQEAAKYLEAKWGTKSGLPAHLFGTMALVKLPGKLSDVTPCKVHALTEKLHFDHRIEVPVRLFRKSAFIRISAQVYNKMEDFEKLGETILEIERSMST